MDSLAGPGPAGRLGLTDAEVAAQRARFGPNELPRPPQRTLARIVLETAREPMFLLMGGAALLYLVLGDVGEGLFLVAAAAASLGLVIVQENRSARALAALRDLAQPQAHVIRDGAERRIGAAELVPGDLLLVGEGERLPADALLVSGDVLSLDESALTGESAPVAKRPALAEDAAQTEPEPGGTTGPHLFAGTVVTRGQGVAEVRRTGAASALGRIGASLASIEVEPTPLQKTARRLVALLGAAALGFCALVAIAYGLLRHDWVEGALAGITTAIALVPEEFPMVLAVFLALGAWRLAAHRVLVRRSAVIEALGAATVLCVDKTGTLTENRMRVARLWTPDAEAEVAEHEPLPPSLIDLAEVAALASAVRPTDPMDRAIRVVSPSDGITEPERSWPVRPERMALIQAWRFAGERRRLAAKGAPEAIAALCRLPPVAAAELMNTVGRYADQGLRVLAVASAETVGEVPADPDHLPFHLLGLVGFIDPLRPDAPAALAEAKAAGVAVVMITGDHPATALAIARAAGLDVSAGALTGAEVAELAFPLLRERLQSVRVFARIAPDQKLLIVEALKANGEVVVMTGDGVNDAPALQAAHIGVAMGRRGTDVAREAAALVLLDDSFASIVGGVRLGRRIFTNLRRALIYVTAIHVPIAGLALLPILLGLPPLLFPMHVVLLELAIDPICALVFEGEPSEAGAMRRPPRRADEPLFGLAQLALSLAQGGVLLAAILGLYLFELAGHPAAEARGAAFAALVIGNLTLALADAFSSAGGLFAPYRRPYWLIAAAAVGLLAVVLALPAAQRIFEVAVPSPHVLAAALAASVLGGGWWALVRAIRKSA